MQTSCQPVQLLPSEQHSILSRTSCSALPWLQRWKGWGSKLWEHTCCRSLVALTAIWRWRSSFIAHRAFSADVIQRAMSTVMNLTCFFALRSKNIFLLWPLMNISFYFCFIVLVAADRLIRYRPAFFFFFFTPVFPEGISTSHPYPT